jgi:energy-coupling factor transport system permease protein
VYETETIINEWHLWKFTIPVTVENTTFAIAQLIRLFSMALFAVVIPYTFDPSIYGVTFRGLGLPDKFAYAMDLAFRLVPTLGRDFSTTYDAQRARGYEMEKLKGGIIAQIRKMAPLLVPVVIQSIVNGEEVIDAMDLRAFGVGPRTWLPKLTYRNMDKILIALSVIILVGSYSLSLSGHGKFWIPEFMMNLAR